MSPRLLAIAASGWLLVVLLAITIRLPYRRWPTAPPWLPLPSGMRLHYWLGYAIAALALVHAMSSMTRGIVGHAHAGGLRLASLALLAAICEVAIGLWLRRPGGTRRWQAIRRLHFAVMTLLVTLVAVHIALDSWLLGTFHGS
jgi:thiosulfate reductase cytochrome b subunit